MNYLIYDVLGPLPDVISVPLMYDFDNITLILWFPGVQLILSLASLLKIGQPLREAAAIDSASGRQMLWKIYLPFLRPMMLLNTVYTVVLLSTFSDNAVNQKILSDRQFAGKAFSYSAAMSWFYLLLFSFVWFWNETYTAGRLMGETQSLLPIKLSLFMELYNNAYAPASSGVSQINESRNIAATLLVIAPLLLIYLVLQKRFIEGIESSGPTGE